MMEGEKLSLKIGIPRALLYYDYFPLWKSLFEELGHEVVLSSVTSKSILDSGVTNCVDDACLPVKLFHGHVVDLIGNVDAIFIPRLISIYPGEYICPKFIGLPDMIKSSIKGLSDLIVLDYNAHRNLKDAYKAYIDLGERIGASASRTEKAFRIASAKQQEYYLLLRQGKTPLDILKGYESTQTASDKSITANNKGVIGLIGHPYTLYDEYISMELIPKLKSKGYCVLVPENITQSQIDQSCTKLPKRLFWSYGKKLLGSGLYMLDSGMVNGIIFLSSFACGVDAFIIELLQRYTYRLNKIPCALITIDEHTGHAGFNTRLEAFIDMMEWRNVREGHISTYGASVSSC